MGAGTLMRAQEMEVSVLQKVELFDILFLWNTSLPNQDIQCYIGGTNQTGCGFERHVIVTAE